MVIVVTISVQPVDEANRLFERAVDLPDEFGLVEADRCDRVIDVRNRRFADADTRNVRRFDQADLDDPAIAAVQY